MNEVGHQVVAKVKVQNDPFPNDTLLDYKGINMFDDSTK